MKQFYVYTDFGSLREIYCLIGPYESNEEAKKAAEVVKIGFEEFKKWDVIENEYDDGGDIKILEDDGELLNEDYWNFIGNLEEFKQMIKQMIKDAKHDYFRRKVK